MNFKFFNLQINNHDIQLNIIKFAIPRDTKNTPKENKEIKIKTVKTLDNVMSIATRILKTMVKSSRFLILLIS